MDFTNIQAQLANLTSQLSQIAEKTTMQNVPTFGASYGQEYPTHQTHQFTANEGAWGYQGYDQPSNNIFPNTYNSDWREYSDYMWGEPQQFSQGGYWQQEEFYSRPMQPPQPPPPQFQSNSSMSMSYNEILDELTSRIQGLRKEEQLQPSEEFYQWPCAPPEPPHQSAQFNSGTSLDNDTFHKLLTSLNQESEIRIKEMQNQTKKTDELEKHVGQIMEFIREQRELSHSNIVNSMGEVEIDEAITLGSDMEEEVVPELSKHSPNVDGFLLQEEEFEDDMGSLEELLPQAPQVPIPSNLDEVVPNSIHSNVIPPNEAFSCRFLTPQNEESEKDIVESLPKVQSDVPILGTPNQVPDLVEVSQEKEVAGEYQECIKEDVHETTKPKEVEFDDTGQIPTIICNLAKFKVPETFKNVVFVIEFVSEQASKPSSPNSILFYTDYLLILMIQAPTLEFKPLPDHFKYHPPFKEKFHAVGTNGV